MRRRVIITLLALGAIGGYAAGFASLHAHAHHRCSAQAEAHHDCTSTEKGESER